MSFLTPLAWDTDFFGISVGRLEIPDASLAPGAVEEGIREARGRNIACLYFEVPFARAAGLGGFNGPGIHLVDIKTTLSKTLLPEEEEEEDGAGEGITDGAAPEHLSDLESIAEDLAMNSRFRYDPHFGESESKRLYREWLRKSVREDFCSDVLVALGVDGMEGFLTVRMKGGAPFIDLLGAARRARGRGVSGRLIRAAGIKLKRRGHESLAVVTQGHNVPALRAYEKSGFQVRSVNLFFHLWPGETAG